MLTAHDTSDSIKAMDRPSSSSPKEARPMSFNRRKASMQLTDYDERLILEGRHYKVSFSRQSGGICQLELFNGRAWHSVLSGEDVVGLNLRLPVTSLEVAKQEAATVWIDLIQEDTDWRAETRYEIHARGYIIATFKLLTRKDGARPLALSVRLGLDEEAVFGRSHRIINEDPTPEMRQAVRGFSVNFSTDERPITYSIDFLLESVSLNANGKQPLRFISKSEEGRTIGWKLTTGWPYPFPLGYQYENRWCLSFTAVDFSPNPVRGQRIYQWFGNIAENFPLPSEDELLEMAEYGCSILVFHLPAFTQIDIQEARKPDEMHRCVKRAHELGMRVLLYTQPYLIRRTPEIPTRFIDKRTECLNVWYSPKDSQVITYLPNFDANDCDELNLRHEAAYRHICDSAIECMRRYRMDGFYVDFAWPAQGLSTNPENGIPGMFNFYDYLRLLREWREAAGEDGLMIGHGGGFLVGSDMIEGFDACLTGEAQRVATPEALGTQYGTAPTHWIIQRNKKDIFRSDKAIENFIREGLTPQVGLGICGKAIIATMDAAYFPTLIALWQMWRAFPMEEATLHHYLSERVLELDNDEIAYSLYTTPRGEVLLLLVNEGGARLDDSPSTGVSVKLDLKTLGLPEIPLRCWRMKGSCYENFRVTEVAPVCNGALSVYEIDHHEFIGYILSPDGPPETLVRLQTHLEGRFERLGPLLAKKMKRLQQNDRQIDDFAKLPHAHLHFSYSEFMAGRIVE